MMKILVTGANGFVGKHLIEKLIRTGHKVDILVRSDEEISQFRGIHHVHTFDITSPFKISDHFDVVIHLAAYNITHVGDAKGSLYTQVNVQGTENLLLAVRTRRFIFLSTAKVYAKTEGLITEEASIAPVQAYEQSKFQAEGLCLTLGSKMEMIILRSTNVYGPGQPKKAVIPIFFTKAIAVERMDVFAPRGSWLQLLHVEDLVSAIVCAAVTPQVQGIFNVAPFEMIRLEDLAVMVKNTCHSSSDIHLSNEAIEPRMEVSNYKIKEHLGWQPSITLEEGLRCYYEYIQKHSA